MAASMSHAAYFDSLVDMIPAKYYLDPEKEPVNIKHMKKADKKAAKRALKAEGRKNKRQKLDPSMAATTLEQQQQRAAEKEQAREAEKEEQPSTSEPALNHVPAADMEELRQRLQAKIQGFRKERNADDQQKTAKKAKAWKEKALSRSKPQPQPQQAPKQRGNRAKPEPGSTTAAATAATQGDAPEEAQLSFGNIEGTGPSRKRKLSKADALKSSEAGAPPSGKAQNETDWKGAMARARGQKVLDNAALLKRAVKREKKDKEKRKKVWSDRLSKQDADRSAKQTKRQDNLQKRVDKKVETKKARREKKLMRPGFEGRRDTFIS